MAKKKPEQIVKDSICEYLELKGIFFWTNHSMGTYDKKKGTWRMRRGRFNLNGTSDILGVLPGGRLLAIECKAKGLKRNVSEDQQYFLDRVSCIGGVAILADSVQDVIDGLTGQIRHF